jgi:hypothetical protein
MTIVALSALLLPLGGVSYLAWGENAPPTGRAGRLVGDDRHTSIARLRRNLLVGVVKIRAFYEATFLAVCARPGCRRNDRHLAATFPVTEVPATR